MTLINELSPPHMIRLAIRSIEVVFSIIKSIHFYSFSSFLLTRQRMPSDVKTIKYYLQLTTSTNSFKANFFPKFKDLPAIIQQSSSFTLLIDPSSKGHTLQCPLPTVIRSPFWSKMIRLSVLEFLFWDNLSCFSQMNILPSLFPTEIRYFPPLENANKSTPFLCPFITYNNSGSSSPISLRS